MPKKVLIIAYYWPPSGGAGVQRWVKFVKYLRDFDWEPVVYTPKENEMPIEDSSLLPDIPENLQIIKRKIWEPYKLFKLFVGAKKNDKFYTGGFIYQKKKAGFAQRIAIFVRGNLFIPDARRFWIKPSVRYLKKYLFNNPVDLIVSTGPPHSMHIIGKKLSKKSKIPWIADFRDPWTKIYFYKDFMLSKWADNKHKKMEHDVLSSANCVVTVGETIAGELKELGAKNIKVITNGFDDEDFAKHSQIEIDSKFTMVHTGNISKTKNHPFLWQALAELADEVQGFKEDLLIKLPGQIDISIKETITKKGMDSNVQYHDYLPHDDIIKMLLEARVLLMMVSDTEAAKGAINGKLFEYLAAKKPIITIAPLDGDIARVLEKCEAGQVCEFHNKEKLKTQILTYYTQYKANKLNIQSKDIETYSRRNLTKEMAAIFNEVISEAMLYNNVSERK